MTKEYKNYDSEIFERLVDINLSKLNYEDVPCANGMLIFCPAKHFNGINCGDWCLLRLARLKTEKEMDDNG